MHRPLGGTIVTKFVWLQCEILVSSSVLRVNLTMPGEGICDD